ncbi:hypothetical protein FRC00_002093 [Tulasnella sp. 408]|nr:hypothetical protein FRC00_002093 [Tulasnella sp. 408]
MSSHKTADDVQRPRKRLLTASLPMISPPRDVPVSNSLVLGPCTPATVAAEDRPESRTIELEDRVDVSYSDNGDAVLPHRGRRALQPADHLPEGPRAPSRSPSPEIRRPGQRRLTIIRKWRTPPNRFGLYREYYRKPSVIPDLGISLQSFTSSSLLPKPMAPRLLPPPSLEDALGPFPNYSTFLHARWLWMTEGAGNSDAANLSLINNVYADEKFNSKDVKAESFGKLEEAVEKYQPDPFYAGDGWKESPVVISVPLGRPRPGDQEGFPLEAEFAVPGLHHRSIVDIVQRVVRTDPNVRDFHLHPFRQYVQGRGGGPPSRVVDDIYSSDAMMEEYEKLQRSPRKPGCPFERIILALQFWSDATQLTNFGSAKLWPVYMYFGNQPKWARSRSDKHACHDIAYIPSLPSMFQDFVVSQRGFPADSKLETHCRRELFHGVWKLLLDKKFIRAYKHGILIEFPDRIIRRVYLRIITYSADYPEKVIIATLRNLGICLCPRCLIVRHQIRKLGLKADMKLRKVLRRTDTAGRRSSIVKARSFIYERGRGVGTTSVEAILRKESLVPTINAFSSSLGQFNFDFFSMLCVDILHEFELGVWKALLLHLIRMLHAVGEPEVVELDRRFREVPPFGRDTIRRIGYNVSELKQLAARDYEDILQCALPAFEGLFPSELDSAVQRLLFVLADWHSVAKLRMHTNDTLETLSLLTRSLGQELRYFEEHVANALKTFETPKEARSRVRRERRKGADVRHEGVGSSTAAAAPGVARKAKSYSLDTYKVHALGDYISQIRLFGTLDVTSTQVGEARHRQKKRQYQRTNKRNFESQIAARTALIENMRFIDQQVALAKGQPLRTGPCRKQTRRDEEGGVGPLDRRYYIAAKGDGILLSKLLQQTRDDCAFTYFHEQLLDHILARLRGQPYSWDDLIFTASEYMDVDLQKDRIYTHGSARFNYTTYDIRRCQDTIKPALHFSSSGVARSASTARCHIMMVADEDDGRGQHPYWYAKVLGVFHCQVRLRSTLHDDYRRMDILWIRWLGVDPDRRGGGKIRRLNRVGFSEGTRDDLLTGKSSVSDLDGEDYKYYSIMRFADRDMAMRYRGGGIGHMKHGFQQDAERPLVNDSESDSEREQNDISDDELSSDGRSSDSESNSSGLGDSDLDVDAD